MNNVITIIVPRISAPKNCVVRSKVAILAPYVVVDITLGIQSKAKRPKLWAFSPKPYAKPWRKRQKTTVMKSSCYKSYHYAKAASKLTSTL